MTDFQAPSEQTWLDRPEWHDRAACAGMEQEGLFFIADRDWEQAMTFRHIRNLEKDLPGIKVCERCPVVEECLEEALADLRLDVGIRGGMTSADRRRERKRRKKRHLHLVTSSSIG